MIKSILLTLLLLLTCIYAFSQSSMINWETSNGGSGNDGAYHILQTNDQGYFVTGYNWSIDGEVHDHHGASWFCDGWVIRLDSNGDTLWTRSLGGTYNEYANGACQTSDGGFLVVCHSQSDDGDLTQNAGSEDMWLVKLTGSGAIEWQRSYGGNYSDNGMSVAELDNGGFLVAGSTSSTNGNITNPLGYSDFWIIKIDNSGNLIWEKTLGGTENEYAYSIDKCPDGNFIVGGYSRSSDIDLTVNNGYTDYWVVKIDTAANIIWQKSLGGTYFEYGTYASATSDGGCIIVGQSNSDDGDVSANHGGNDAWAVKLDSGGNIEWDRAYGGSLDDSFYNVQQTAEGGYLFAGISSSSDGDATANHGGEDAWIVKTDYLGTIEWQESYGGDSIDYAFFGIQLDDGSFTFAGLSNSINGDVSTNFGAVDFWVVNLKCVPLSPPEICMVTVDSITGSNVIVWDPTAIAGVETYYIYRESIIAGQYNVIGAVNAGQPSYFEDATVDPAVQAYRYKLSAIDTCGNMSEQGGFHETMHLNVNVAGGGGYNLIWDHYVEESGNQIAFGDGSYYIYRGTNPDNMQLHYTISSNNTSWTDTDDTQLFYYRITAKKLDSCYISLSKTLSGPYSQSFSNLDDNGITGTETISETNRIEVAPNPYSQGTNIMFSTIEQTHIRIEVYNLIGDQICSLDEGIKDAGQYTYHFSASEKGYPSGVYLLKLFSNDQVKTKKLIELN